MGEVIHKGMFVTCFNSETLSAVFEMAKSLFPKGSVTPVMQSPANAYETFAITPSGSKTGWTEADNHDTNIETLINYMRMYDYEDHTSPLEWAVVEYGHTQDYKIKEKQRQYELKKQAMEIKIQKQKELLARQVAAKVAKEAVTDTHEKE